MAGERPEGGAPATRTHELAAEGEGMRHCPRFARLGIIIGGLLPVLIGSLALSGHIKSSDMALNGSTDAHLDP